MATKTIVAESEILDLATMAEENWTLRELNFPSTLDVLKWCAKRGLIRNSYECEECHYPKTFIKRNKKTCSFMWKCNNCLKENSVRNGSFFENSRLPIEKILVIIYCWTQDYPQTAMAHEAGLGRNCGHTTSEWCNKLRKVCEQNLKDHPTSPEGFDENKEMNNDVRMLAKRKFRRQFGTSQAFVPSYIKEFIWRNKNQNKNIFSKFLICVREQYNVGCESIKLP